MRKCGYWRQVVIYVSLVCLLLVGCGSAETEGTGSEIKESGVNAVDGTDTAGIESGESSVSESAEIVVSSYSEEDDRTAADYLKEKYGIFQNGACPKVILDCDMTYLGDDAMCLSILVQADTIGLIDLLGVTITGGNNFVSYGTNAALVQLERMGRADIPVYMGTDIPINGVRDLEKQAEIVGEIDNWGALYHFDEYVEPARFHDLGDLYERKWGYSQTDPKEMPAADFMTEQAAKYKGEVTILAVGAATNVATACKADPEFAANAAGIYYMGTVIEEGGSFTPYADFNCFYDAEGYDICLRSAFPVQTVIPHEASDTAVLTKSVYDMLDTKGNTLISRFWVDNQYSLYRRNPNYTMSCSDAIAAVVFLNPNVVEEKRMLALSVNADVNSPEYGSVTVAEGGGINVVMTVETEEYWEFVTDLLCHVQGE